jgi:hypothetical protein
MATLDFVVNKGGDFWQASRLSRSWMLHIDTDVLMRKLMKNAEKHLLAAESA